MIVCFQQVLSFPRKIDAQNLEKETHVHHARLDPATFI